MRALLLSFLMLASTAMAVEVNPAGQRLAATCANCHGTNGVSAGGGMGGLAGMQQAVMLKALRDFRSGSRPATVMQQLAKGYSDEELVALAAWFAARPPTTPQPK